ncbi:MAG: GNAT family N-acetyltransferase [Clostridia bacterium]|nr:GNAT family N-acetyltransferase [Clostridia bacterium]
MNHKGTQTIETKRLILRQFKISDAKQMFDNWANDIEVTKYLTWSPHGSPEVTKALLSDWVSSYQNDSYYNWCIELKETSQAIGSIGTVKILEYIDAVSIGYCIAKEYWRKGIMTEALNAVIKFFFDEVGVNRIAAAHDTDNPASGRVMAKCGMKYEGTFIQAASNNHGICDIAVYGLVKRDYTGF